MRADEKVDSPITQLLGKHDLVTNLYPDRVGWSAYTTCGVSRKGQRPEGRDGKA
jgi:hypothetical protein